MQEREWACESCGSVHKQLQVHHLIYDGTYRRPEHYPSNLLEVLCDECHSWRESWNVVFGRTINSTKQCRSVLQSGVRNLLTGGLADEAEFQYAVIKHEIPGYLFSAIRHIILTAFPRYEWDALLDKLSEIAGEHAERADMLQWIQEIDDADLRNSAYTVALARYCEQAKQRAKR